MSHTDRHDKREPEERPFPYVPRGVVIVSTGHANSAQDNRAYVRQLLDVRHPEFAQSLNLATAITMHEGCKS